MGPANTTATRLSVVMSVGPADVDTLKRTDGVLSGVIPVTSVISSVSCGLKELE